MKTVVLGKTGLRISELGFGGIPIIRLSPEEAVSVLRRAYDLGVTFFDTANVYHDSEEKMGDAFLGIRDAIVLATKSMKRTAQGAADDIERSRKMLRTDRIDLFQFHQVSQEADWQAITGPGGAMEAAEGARKAGKILHIGITSHSIPMAIRLIKTGFFETIQFPFNFIEDEAARELHPIARSLGLGILAMKPFAGGAISDARTAFAFLRAHEGVVPIPGCDSVASVEEIASFYRDGLVATGEDLGRMRAIKDEIGTEFCRRCEYCMPCPRGIRIAQAMIYPLLAHRMSPAVASGFSKAVMDAVPDCVSCGICTKRCPYSLPIPRLLRENHELYLRHCSEVAPD